MNINIGENFVKGKYHIEVLTGPVQWTGMQFEKWSISWELFLPKKYTYFSCFSTEAYFVLPHRMSTNNIYFGEEKEKKNY